MSRQQLRAGALPYHLLESAGQLELAASVSDTARVASVDVVVPAFGS